MRAENTGSPNKDTGRKKISDSGSLSPLALCLLAYGTAGIVSGMLLGLMLKAIQTMTGHRVYRLLLNADYVPVLKEFRLSEWTEFVIHLVISVVLCIVLGLLWQRRSRNKIPSAQQMVGVTAAIGALIGLLLYPTTLLSAGGTPPIDSLPAWLWWGVIHLLYGAASGLLLHTILTLRVLRPYS
ncbi:hypothetical protein [Saccharibacillus kuerlensis]|uniref:Uncharacterized protein n=1 Tax=Saccharibacillus kuerlensis TaxID=459527 RepID=A0ABQ2L1P4_9BACL|nr:hypothetical protein [Saccharibacillus kuerlensis]GGN97918.1 hypothetical protein GCM10010969_16310 [Saccharibacillus kuerlensis]